LPGISDAPRPPATPADLQAARIEWPSGPVEAQIMRDLPFNFAAQLPLKQSGTRYGRPEFTLGVSNDELNLSNELGEIVLKFPFRRATTEGQASFLRAQIDGGLILLETQSELLAFDLYRGMESSLDALLWRHSLLAVAAGPAVSHRAPSVQAIPSPFGFVLHSRGAAQRETVIGPITPTGVVLQQGTEVLMLHPLSGSKVWGRRGYSDQTALAHAGTEIAVVDPSRGAIEVLDCRDGSLLRSLPYSGDWTHWFTHGRMLTQFAAKEASENGRGIYSDRSSAAAVRVVDVLSGQVVLEEKFAALSRTDWAEDRYLVVVEPQGRVWYCDVATGQTAEHTLPPFPRLEQVRLQAFGDRLVVLTSLGSSTQNATNVAPRVDENAMARGIYSVNGPIFAMDKATGHMLWDRPGKLSSFRFGSLQPRSSPFMTFYRFVRPAPGANSQSQGNVVVVDIRDGRMAYLNEKLPNDNRNNETFTMKLDPLVHLLWLSIGDHALQLRVTDGEQPPEPVVYYGQLAPQRRASRNDPPLFDNPPTPAP
jgi:hypothetical protein